MTDAASHLDTSNKTFYLSLRGSASKDRQIKPRNREKTQVILAVKEW
jgi:hypothetical protein